jgi:hypothetical protein
MENTDKDAPYGYCLKCGSKGVSRERRPNGNDKCENGHTYPSASAIMNDVKMPAINVKQECCDVYYENYKNIPEALRKQISCYMLAEIFRNMVVPAIDKARELDRENRNN